MIYKQFKKIIKNLLKFLLQAVVLVLSFILNLAKLIGHSLLKALVEYGDMRLKHRDLLYKHDINQRLYKDKTDDIQYRERKEKE